MLQYVHADFILFQLFYIINLSNFIEFIYFIYFIYFIDLRHEVVNADLWIRVLWIRDNTTRIA